MLSLLTGIAHTTNAQTHIHRNNTWYHGSTGWILLFSQQPYGEVWVSIDYYETGEYTADGHIFFAITYTYVASGSVLYGNNYKIDWVRPTFYIDTPARSPKRQILLDRGPGNGWPIYYCQVLYGCTDYRAFVDLDYSSAYLTYCYYAPAGVDITDYSSG